MQDANVTIAQILRFDSRTNSYKLALVRAINDIVLAHPTPDEPIDVLVPLHLIASHWIAYYWCFVDTNNVIFQGARNFRGGKLWNDIAFRDGLTELREQFTAFVGASKPSDGYYLLAEMQVARRRNSYPSNVVKLFKQTTSEICRRVEYPIQYAGRGGENWGVFPKPVRADEVNPHDCYRLPQVTDETRCLLIPAVLWSGFKALSLWIEALCIHEWCLFTEGLKENSLTRGDVYNLLTDRPDNRRPLTWERNQVDILLMEGQKFTCPWSQKVIQNGTPYNLDHLIPIAIYPANDLWNLLPSDPDYNQNTKRARLPSQPKLAAAAPIFELSYSTYLISNVLGMTLLDDAQRRFVSRPKTASSITTEVVQFIERMTELRSVETF